MNIDINLPQKTLLTFRRDGEVILSVEAVYLDLILVSSQKSSYKPVNPADENTLWWLPRFTQLVNQKWGLDVSDSEAWVMAHACYRVAQELKKSFDSIQTSLQRMDSILSSSQPENSKPSTSASPESKPDENSTSEFASHL